MFKVNDKDTRTTLMSLSLVLNICHTTFFSVSIAYFQQVMNGWDSTV